MNLVIDIGNTRSKLAIFDNGKIIDIIMDSNINIPLLKDIFKQYPIQNSILSSVKLIKNSILDFLIQSSSFFVDFNEDIRIPIENLYKTKKTLGKDRLISAIGANNFYPYTNVLVVDLGTAITFDLINDKNQYMGGTISPGLEMRFKALNHFTDKLPLLEKSEDFNIICDNTKEAIVSGVQNGIIFEIDSYIDLIKGRYKDLKIFLTGGDAIFFDKKLKNSIFVNSELIFLGLNRVLEYNIR